MKTLTERFFSKMERIPFSGYWLWTAGLDGGGYGQMGKGKYKKLKAHRLSYEIHYGQIPTGMSVLHKCDIPSCVNPDHLFLGSQQDNMRDMKLKGRGVRGESQGSSKLTADEIVKIINATGYQYEIAAQFGISQTQVSRIKSRKHWRHVEIPQEQS